jgi:hypothetical protein
MAAQLKITPADDELAKAINRDARSNPDSPYAGKYVGILDGKVVVVCDDLNSAVETLREMEPDRLKGLIVEASADYDTPVEIWQS